MSRATVLLLGVLLTGCHGAAQGASGPDGSGQDPGPVARYLPLENNTVLAYVTHEENTGEKGLIVLEVTRPRPGSIELRDGGTTTRLGVEPDGISYLTGGHWLKAPLTVGACWQGKSGRACVSRINQSVQVPAGQFQGCLETTETTASGSRVVTVFCPGVGMTMLDAENDAGGQYQHVRAQLRSHGPKVDIDHLPPDLAEPAPRAVPSAAPK